MINVTNNLHSTNWLYKNSVIPEQEVKNDNIFADKDLNNINRFKLNSARTPSISKNKRK